MKRAVRFVLPMLLLSGLGLCIATKPNALRSEVSTTPAKPKLDAAQQALADRLDAAVRATCADPEMPPVLGLAVKVVCKGAVLLDRGYGFTDPDGLHPLPANAIFRVGSITKQFTAAAILQLEEQGKLKLSEPVGKYLKEPYLKDGGKPLAQVTLQQLLTHTSGIPNLTELPWYGNHKHENVAPADVVAAFADLPLEFEPGTRFSYSNSGYYLLGLLVEQVSGRGYAEYLREHVFVPAGLVDSRYCPDAQDYPRATPGYEGYSRLLKTWPYGHPTPAAPISMKIPFAAGGLCSSTSDLVRWVQALSSGKVIHSESFARMRSETILKSGQRSPYGFGLNIGELAQHPCIYHAGGIDGFASFLAYYPNDDLYIAVLANTNSLIPGGLSEQLARIVLSIAPVRE